MSGIFFFIFPLAFSPPPHPKLTSERDEILGPTIYGNGKKKTEREFLSRQKEREFSPE